MLYNYYKILGISEAATTEEVRKAYREKAKLYHPDLNSSAKAHELFAVLNDANTTLTDVRKREMYDLKLQYGRFQSTTETTSEDYRKRDPRYYGYRPTPAPGMEEDFEPGNVLFYSFFSAGTLCGLSFCMVPFLFFMTGNWNPILIAPFLLGVFIMKDGITELVKGLKQKLGK